jgi:hypothetical protein
MTPSPTGSAEAAVASAPQAMSATKENERWIAFRIGLPFL